MAPPYLCFYLNVTSNIRAERAGFMHEKYLDFKTFYLLFGEIFAVIEIGEFTDSYIMITVENYRGDEIKIVVFHRVVVREWNLQYSNYRW
jgi:hypothetical protein